MYFKEIYIEKATLGGVGGGSFDIAGIYDTFRDTV